MNREQFDAAVDKLETAITDITGEIRKITRIELEPIGSQVRWTLWEGPHRVYSATDRDDAVDGFLSATRMILDMQCEDDAGEPASDPWDSLGITQEEADRG